MNEELILDCIEVLVKSEAAAEQLKLVAFDLRDEESISLLTKLEARQRYAINKLREAL